MPLHPSPPQDLPGAVEAYRQCVQAVIDLGRGLSDEQRSLPTDCPGWTVHDQLAHVAALEAHLEGFPSPPADIYPEYVDGPVARFTHDGVAARRGTSGAALTRELEHVLALRMASLTSPGLEPDSLLPALPGPGGLGPVAPVMASLRLRTLDVWVHEQDIREALGRPGDLDSPAAAVFCDTAFAVVPRAVARGAQVPLGDTVIIELTGPVTGRIGVRVEDVDGRPHGAVLFGTSATDRPTSTTTSTLRAIDPDARITTIKLSTGAFARLAAGRRDVDDVPWSCSGDDATARAVLAHLRFTP